MLILTQRKSEIVNLNSLERVFVEPEVASFNPGWIIFARGTSGKSVPLGRYENEVRAKEVLREIFMEYQIPEKPKYEMPDERRGKPWDSTL